MLDDLLKLLSSLQTNSPPSVSDSSVVPLKRWPRKRPMQTQSTVSPERQIDLSQYDFTEPVQHWIGSRLSAVHTYRFHRLIYRVLAGKETIPLSINNLFVLMNQHNVLQSIVEQAAAQEVELLLNGISRLAMQDCRSGRFDYLLCIHFVLSRSSLFRHPNMHKKLDTNKLVDFLESLQKLEAVSCSCSEVAWLIELVVTLSRVIELSSPIVSSSLNWIAKLTHHLIDRISSYLNNPKASLETCKNSQMVEYFSQKTAYLLETHSILELPCIFRHFCADYFIEKLVALSCKIQPTVSLQLLEEFCRLSAAYQYELNNDSLDLVHGVLMNSLKAGIRQETYSLLDSSIEQLKLLRLEHLPILTAVLKVDPPKTILRYLIEAELPDLLVKECVIISSKSRVYAAHLFDCLYILMSSNSSAVHNVNSALLELSEQYYPSVFMRLLDKHTYQARHFLDCCLQILLQPNSNCPGIKELFMAREVCKHHALAILIFSRFVKTQSLQLALWTSIISKLIANAALLEWQKANPKIISKQYSTLGDQSLSLNVTNSWNDCATAIKQLYGPEQYQLFAQLNHKMLFQTPFFIPTMHQS